jgi:hypothetical protein
MYGLLSCRNVVVGTGQIRSHRRPGKSRLKARLSPPKEPIVNVGCTAVFFLLVCCNSRSSSLRSDVQQTSSQNELLWQMTFHYPETSHPNPKYPLLETWSRAVPWLRRLAPGLPPRRPGFDPGSVHVGFVVDKVALGQVFLRVLRFSPVSFIPPVLHY